MNRVVDNLKQSLDLLMARLAGNGGGCAPGCLGNDRIEVLAWKSCARKNSLIVKKHVAGEEDCAVLVYDLYACGSSHVAGGKKGNLDFIGVEVDSPGMAEGHGKESGFQSVDLTVREKRILRYSVFLTLPIHYIYRVAEHPGRQDGVRNAGQHTDFRVMAEENG